MLSLDSYASSAACQTNNPTTEASSLISSSLHSDFTQDNIRIGPTRNLLAAPLPSNAIADYNSIQSSFRESHDYGMVNNNNSNITSRADLSWLWLSEAGLLSDLEI